MEPQVSTQPAPDARCACCGESISLEMERDEILCLECQRLAKRVAHV